MASVHEPVIEGKEVFEPILEIETEDKWVKRARPTIVFAAVLIMLVQYAVLPIAAQFSGHELKYMDEFAVVAILAPVVTYVISRTIEKIRGVA